MDIWTQPKGGNIHQTKLIWIAQLPKASVPFLALCSFPRSFPASALPTVRGRQSRGARGNSNKPKRLILSQIRKPNPFSVWPKERQDYPFWNHIQTQQHHHAFWCQLSLIQDWAKTALKKLSDATVSYRFTVYSNALGNRLILFSIRLHVRKH